jgi:hypothetical protein
MDPYTHRDLAHSVKTWKQISGFQTHIRNGWGSVIKDGSLNGIQVVTSIAVGELTNSATPECDGPNSNQSHGQFSVILPPNYDIDRKESYGVVFLSPGGGGTHLDLALSTWDGPPVHGIMSQTFELLAKSVENGGEGLVVIIGNSGGQMAGGVQQEYTNAVNSFFEIAAVEGNIDL